MDNTLMDQLTQKILAAMQGYVERSVNPIMKRIGLLETSLEATEERVAKQTSIMLQKFADLPVPKDGKDGEKGIDGKDGINGKDGTPGPQGEKGIDGKDGINGKDGTPGPQGEKGLDGKDGVNGKDGEKGIDGKDGINGKDGMPGPQGEKGLDGKDGVLGPQGEKGLDGKDGTPGPQGEKGIDGKDGTPGPQGEKGIDGKDGVNGKDGTPGPQGEKGIDGKDGVNGKDGTPGPQGEKGIDGRDGRDSKQVGPPGKDALEIEILPNIDITRQYQRGTYASWDGGIVRSIRVTDPLENKTLEECGWAIVLRGITSFTVAQDETLRTISVTTRLTGGTENTKTFAVPVLLYRGLYREDISAEPGDAYTFGGSIWIAQRTTKDKPGTTDAWKLAVKHGRDGKDGELKVSTPQKPVTLK